MNPSNAILRSRKGGYIASTTLALSAVLAFNNAVADGEMAETSLKDYAVTVYGGRLTDGLWLETLTMNADFIESDLLVAAVSHTLARSSDHSRSYEVEAQVGKHFGLQDNWEYNLLGVVRWHKLPWSGKLASSFAVGLGVSYAPEIPPAEVQLYGVSEKLLAHWHLELTLGPPKSNWQASFRLHHRSAAYGLFGDNGGYNALALGVRYQFE